MTSQSTPEPVDLFTRASRDMETVMSRVAPGQLHHSTPCRDWTVQNLIDHIVGGTDLSSRRTGRRSAYRRKNE
jgi:hypothetical protein